MFSFLGAVNTFKGRIEGPNLQVGTGALPHNGTLLLDGSDVVAYARPHEIEIVTDAGRDLGIAAQVGRIHPMGAMARVELIGKVGRNGSAEQQVFEVEIPRDELCGLGLASGQSVRLVSRQLHVFDGGPGARLS